MRIISQDGGGVRAVLGAESLSRLHQEDPSWLSRVDVFAGTSGGALNACFLASGRQPHELVTLYDTRAREIFAPRDWWDRWVGKGDEWWRADYDNRKGLKKILDSVFGDSKLGSLEARVLVPAIYLGNGTRSLGIKVFHNFDERGNDKDWKIVDVLMATAAAPFYFPTASGAKHLRGQFVDGGLALNNPSVSALAQVLDSMRREHAEYSLEQCSLLSLGSGRNPKVLQGGDWGIKHWIRGARIVDVAMDSQVGGQDYICRHLLRSRYHRCDVTLAEPVSLDDASEISSLIGLAKKADLSGAQNWIQENWGVDA